MAVGTKADFVIFHEQFWGGMNEILQQNADIFNERSRGAFRFVTRQIKGDFEQESFIKSIGSLVSRRDTLSVADATSVKVEQDQHVGVKLNRKIGPVDQTRDAWRKISLDNETASFLIGQQVGVAISVEWANSAIRAVATALSGVPALTYTENNTISHTTLVRGMAKLGDASNRIVAWVMHSKVAHDLLAQGIADKIFEVAGVSIIEGTIATFGKPAIFVDSPALVVSGSPDTYRTLGLQDMAVEVAESEERDIVFDTVTGKNNLIERLQGEYAFNLRVKGFKWDIANGGENPTDAAVADSDNWDKVMADDKSLAGVLILTK